MDPLYCMLMHIIFFKVDTKIKSGEYTFTNYCVSNITDDLQVYFRIVNMN